MEYELKRDIKIPKGTRVTYPAPIAKEALTYAHATAHVGFEAAKRDEALHVQVPLDAALKDGLIGEAE
jgi:hypothetical protein